MEAGSETQEGEDGPEEQDAGRRHGWVTPAVMPPADWLFRQEKQRVARGAWRVADRVDADVRAVTVPCLFLIAFATSSDSGLSAPDLEPDG